MPVGAFGLFAWLTILPSCHIINLILDVTQGFSSSAGEEREPKGRESQKNVGQR